MSPPVRWGYWRGPAIVKVLVADTSIVPGPLRWSAQAIPRRLSSENVAVALMRAAVKAILPGVAEPGSAAQIAS